MFRSALRALTSSLIVVVLLGGGCIDPGSTAGSDGPPSDELADAVRKAGELHPEARKRKIVLLGFDSCDPDLVEQMIRKGQLPNFARMRREGTSGLLRSIPPYLSPVVWTTVATGMRPDRHGILDFMTARDGEPVPVSSEMRQADTVWEVLSRFGEEVGIVGWLVSYPAEPLPGGFLVTEQVGQLAYEYGDQKRELDAGKLVYPAELDAGITADKVDVDDIPLAQIRPFAAIDEQQYADAYSRTFSPKNLIGNLRLTMATAEGFRNMGTRLLEERRPRFFACYFEAMDVLSHLFMRYAPPKRSEVDLESYRLFSSAMEANYKWHDRVLGEFMDLADEDTTVLVVSDHGFKSGEFRLSDPSVFHARTGAMWHRSYGSIFAWGGGVKQGERIQGATVYDIAPTVLAAMGYPVPKDMAGRPLTALFEDGLEYETIDTYFGEERRDRIAKDFVQHRGDEFGGLSPEERERIEQWKAMGYVSGNRSDAATGALNLGSIFMARGQFEKALEQFEGVRAQQEAEHEANPQEVPPPTPRVHFAIAEALLGLDRTAEAQEAVNRAVETVQRDAARLEAAMAQGFKPEDPTATPASIRASVAPEVQSFLTRIALKNGKLEEALRSAEKLRELKPDRPNVHTTYATVREALSKQVRGQKPLPEGALEQALLHLEEAIRAYERALALEPNMFHALKEVARLRLESHEWVKTGMQSTMESLALSREELEHALELFPNSPDTLNNYTIALMRTGIAHRMIGRAEDAESWFGKARATVDKVNELYPTYPKGWANKAYLMWQTGQIEEAHKAAKTAREIRPDYVFNKQMLAEFTKRGLTLDPPPPPNEDS